MWICFCFCFCFRSMLADLISRWVGMRAAQLGLVYCAGTGIEQTRMYPGERSSRAKYIQYSGALDDDSLICSALN